MPFSKEGRYPSSSTSVASNIGLASLTIPRDVALLRQPTINDILISEAYHKIKLSILIPVYNERSTIREIIERVCAVDVPKEIIVVDDCSTDGTREVLKEIELLDDVSYRNETSIRVVYHDRNRGKGGALHTALEHVTGDIIIVQDADLEYDPDEYFQLTWPIVLDKADVVYGSRFQGEGPHRVLYFWHSIGNRLITLFSNMFTNLNLSDVETGYKAFRTDVLKNLELNEKDFGFEIEVTSKVARSRVRVYEVGISYFGRTYAEGKKISWKDGLRAFYLTLKYR